MAETVELSTKPRKDFGSSKARQLRRQDLVPAVVYGHGEPTVSIVLPREELETAIRRGAHVLDLKTDAKVQKCLIREVQWDHLGIDLLHVDFARIALDERVVVTVPVELRGQLPGTAAGGVLDQPLHTISVECLAIAIPASIRVPINEMQIGSIIHVRELHLPEGVKVMADPDAIVVQVKAPIVEAEAPAAAAPVAGETAEPEVIGRKEKPAEEEGEEKKEKK
jgi:large subunit ribosomal protein L25